MGTVAEDVQLLGRLEKLVLAKGQSVATSVTGSHASGSQPQSVAEDPAHFSSDEDDHNHSSERSKDLSSARSLGSIPRRSSNGESSVPSAEASVLISATSADVSSSWAKLEQPSALHYYKPHDGFAHGCPAPACFEERVSTAKSIHQKMDLRDGELESTLRLLCKVFDVETATVSLLTGERIYLVGACGALPVSAMLCMCAPGTRAALWFSNL